MGEAAHSVGGVGGGHDIAAGATIPEGTESEFLKHLNRLIGQQVS
jgi:RecJ-like exonuclease